MKEAEREIAEYYKKFRPKGNEELAFHHTEEVFSLAGQGFFLQMGGNSLLAKSYLDHMIDRFPDHPYSNFIYGLYLFLSNESDSSRIYFQNSIRLALFFHNPKIFLDILSTNKAANRFKLIEGF